MTSSPRGRWFPMALAAAARVTTGHEPAEPGPSRPTGARPLQPSKRSAASQQCVKVHFGGERNQALCGEASRHGCPWTTSPNACVATAPTPALAHGTSEPTANMQDATATPSSPVAGSRATIE